MGSQHGVMINALLGHLITGQSPELGGQLAAPALDCMHSRSWQLHLNRYAPPITDSRQHQVT